MSSNLINKQKTDVKKKYLTPVFFYSKLHKDLAIASVFVRNAERL